MSGEWSVERVAGAEADSAATPRDRQCCGPMASRQGSAPQKSAEVFLADSAYLLELNLQKVRLELISMIEMFEHKDCDVCKQLKCSCTESIPPPAAPTPPTVPTAPAGGGSGSVGRLSNDTSSADFSTKAPSANVLPKPMWKSAAPGTSGPQSDVQAQEEQEVQEVQDVESWVRASRPGARPDLPEERPRDWPDEEPPARPCLALVWSDWADIKLPADADAAEARSSFVAIMSKMAYDSKGRSKSSLHWPGLKTNSAHAARKYGANVCGDRPAAKPAAHRSRAKLALDLVSSPPGLREAPRAAREPLGGRSAVDAFFHSFKQPAAAGAPADVPRPAGRLASAFKAAQGKATGYTYF